MSAAELQTVLDMYEDVMDDFHVSIALPWEKACAAANAANLHKLIEVLTGVLRRRSEKKPEGIRDDYPS